MKTKAFLFSSLFIVSLVITTFVVSAQSDNGETAVPLSPTEARNSRKQTSSPGAEQLQVQTSDNQVVPIIAIDPSSFDVTQPAHTTSTHELSISNDGSGDLNWEITEAGPGLRTAQTNLIADPSFEGGTPNADWTEAGSLGSPICDPAICGATVAHTGIWYAWFGGWAQPNTASVSQSVVIPSDTGIAFLSFWTIMGGGSAPDGLLEVRVDGMPLKTFTEADIPNYREYTQVFINVSGYADGGSHTIEFYGEEYGTGLSNFFIDDVELSTDFTLCNTAVDLPWVSVSPSIGTAVPGSPSTIDVTFDSTGLTNGLYEGTLCVHSNDTQNPIVGIPLSLNVEGDPPQIDLNPASLAHTQPTDSVQNRTLNIGNLGDEPLNWNAITPGGLVEVVNDGGFELGSPNPHWTTSTTAGAQPICSPSACGPDFARTGLWYGWFGGSAGPLTVTAMQTIDIPLGASEMDFWMFMIASSGSAGTFEGSIDGEVVAAFDETDKPDFADYSLVTSDISAYADGGTHTLLLEMNNPGGPNINFIVDDISIKAPYDGCKPINDISWLDMDATFGTVFGQSAEPVSVTFDSTGLADGEYMEHICISSNDPLTSFIDYPVTMTVKDIKTIYLPVVLKPLSN